MSRFKFFNSRRRILYYLARGAAGAIGTALLPQIGWSKNRNLENLCSLFPENSRCDDYLPGVQALDSEEIPIEVSVLLTTVQSGDRVRVRGLDRDAYLVIEEGPAIASYGISSVCTHMGCTVNWDRESNQFHCPCHGSEYDAQGRVVRGPARRSLDLLTVVTRQEQIGLVERSPALDPRD